MRIPANASLRTVVGLVTLVTLGVGAGRPAGGAEERQRRNIFGIHNLNYGQFEDAVENMEWTQHLVGRGFVFDWVRDGAWEAWIDAAFRLNLVPCIRVQEGTGGQHPSAAHAKTVAERILNYKIAHPEYADRLVYLQLWNEPNDPRDFVPPAVYADYLVEAHNGIHQAESDAAAAHPGLGLQGTLKTMTPGQNGPSWWDQAFTHNPDAKFAFDVWGTHPYPEAAPPHYNHHDGDVFIETTKTIDGYLQDLDVVARPHGSPPRSRRGFPVMITETAYGNKLGISYEGWPKTNRRMAADYNVDAFGERWYRWPEILAVHPFLLAHPGWEAFAWVPGSSCSAPPAPGCSAPTRCSQDCNGDGVREPRAPHLQYDAVRQLRLAREAEGMLPARASPYRGPTGSIRGRITRADTSTPVFYATVRTDGYAFGHVSLYDGFYEVHGVPVGTYTLSAEKNGFRSSSKQVSVVANDTVTVDFPLVHTGRVSKGIYFIDSPPHPGCPGCNLFDRTLGQTFTTPASVGFIKYAAAKPHVDGVTLKFSILEGGPTGPQVGPSITATLEPGDGANMIGGEWPDGQEPAVEPGQTYFLKIERADGQGIYCFASNSNPYPDGNAWVGTRSLSGVDFVAVIRGLTVAVNTAAGALAGFVMDSTGAPIAGASVTTAPGGQSAVTDAGGAYTLSGVPAGSYQVSAAKAGYVTATSTGIEVLADQTTILDFTLSEAAAPGSIHGTVRDTSDRPLSGADVTTTEGGHRTATDASGAYVLSGVAPGTYAVAASKAGYTPQTQSGVVVSTGAATTLDFHLAPVAAPPPTIVNPNFEDDHGFFGVAQGWTRFGANKWEAVWDKDRVFTQGVSEISTSTGTGVYQTIDVIPNAAYRVTVFTKVTAAGYAGVVGVDPAGGIGSGSATYGVASASTSWTPVTVTFEAKEPKATIFLRGNRETPLIGWVQFDGVTIEPTGDSATRGPVSALLAPALSWSSDAFEEFVYQPGLGQIPRNWSPWFENASPASPGSREWNIVPGESGWAQEFRKSNVRIGLFRAASGFTPGQSYLIKLRAKWLSGAASPPLCSVGIHPTAGTEPGEVTWAPGGPVASKSSWSTVQGTLTVPNASATLFIKVDFGGLVDYGVAIDNLEVQPAGSGNQPPTVSLSADRTTATAPGSFVLTASASDADGSISKVEFYQGSTLLSADTAAPYSYAWSGVPAGSFSLTARAYDNASASAVSNTVTVVVNAPPSTRSKLTIHAGWGGHSDYFIRNAKPRVVKVFDEVKNAALIKQLSPGTLVIGRLFPGSVPDGVLNNGSPADRASDWWNTVKAAVLAYPDVDYWEGLNEPVVTSASTMSWYAQFEIARIDILAANGRKACIGNFATGNPDLSLWPSFVAAVDHALAQGGIMGLHEYGTPMTQFWDEPTGEGWLCGRYRKVYRQHLQGREIPLVITETGVDEGTLAANGPGQPKPRPIDAQANHGWQQALGTPPVAGFPPPGDLAARKPWYLAQLKWYDGILKQDSYVLGATIYQLEIPGWASFDVGPLLQELTDYVAPGGVNASPTVSLSTDKTSAPAPGSFVLTASASDPDGSISKVEFYQGSTLLSTDTAAPYSYTWAGVAAGSYDLTARAYDDAGASAVSNAIMVSVTVTPTPPTTMDPGLVWLSDNMDAHGGGLVKKWSKWWSGTGNTEWNIVPGEGGWWAQEVKKNNVNVGVSRPNRGFKAGDAYRLRFRARKTMGSGSPRCYAGVQPSGGGLLWGASVSVTSTTSWVDVSYDFVASQFTTTLFLRADLTGFTDVGVAFDNVAVELLSPRDPEPWMISGAPPVEPLNLHGIHDAGAEDIFVQANRKGWVTEALAIESNPNDQSGHRFPQWIDGLGVIGRIAHLFGQILPAPGPAPQYPGLDAFAERAANFVKNSVGCGIWSIGNEPHLEGVQDPALYAEAFVRAYRAIKAVRPQAKVITAGFVHGDNGDTSYFKAALLGIESRGVVPDGIALHTYTDSQGWNETSFRDYQTKIASLPASMRQLPVYITEAGTGGPGNPTTNTGLINTMLNHVHQWNASASQQVRSVCIYRWTAGADKWAIEENAGMRADFIGSLSNDYRWDPAAGAR